VVRMMVGRELDQLFPPRNGGREDTVLEVRNLSGPGYANVSLDIRSGKVLGVFGLTGAGRTELARGIFGIEPITGGEILILGRPVKITDPRKAMNEGIAYIPEDRKQDGLFLEMSLVDNVAVACLRALSGTIFMHGSKGVALARDAMGKLMIKARGVEQRVSSLSGGNQQKVLFAKWLARHPKVLIADEPTRGTDVGAKAEIHTLLRKLAKEGAAVVMISSELPEIMGMSDRVAVMRQGRLVALLDRNQATEERVAAYALGASGDGAAASWKIDNE
jgi:ABC-type sugar transport system ATPase subunit